MGWTTRFRSLSNGSDAAPAVGDLAAADADLASTRQSVVPLFILFTISGFTGLIYESLWSHYLKLFLGHAAFAQSFVLIVFMGGVALGAWLASRLTARIENLLAWYGVIEAMIGVLALAFHPLFVWLMNVSLDRVLPAIGRPGLVEAYKLSLSAVLTLPPSRPPPRTGLRSGSDQRPSRRS
jgi:spermidine synthase